MKNYFTTTKGSVESHYIKVYCAWCKKYLYNIETNKKSEFKASHGICKGCIKKYFQESDK